jgi:mono/diheme cytochrome c family protein
MTYRIPVFAAMLGAGCAGFASGEGAPVSPVVPGLHQKHPLSERQAGELLIAELRCASCHEGMDATHMKAAPDLREVGSRLNPEFIRRFIADPAAVHPGTTMPGLLAAEKEENRRAISESITAYLLSLQAPAAPAAPAGSKPAADASAGRDLYHGVGCVACHAPRDDAGRETPSSGDVPLAHIPAKYRDAYVLADFLLDPLKVRPAGRMPDMNLTKAEAASIAGYLMAGAAAPSVETQQPDAQAVAVGKAAFEKFNCASCHQIDEPAAARPAPPLAKLDPRRGCLSGQPGTAPDFRLDPSQVAAIRAALTAPAQEPVAADRIKLRLTQLNCISCHVRDDYGGVAESRNGFFKSSEEALGNEARIPPPLTLAGAKFKPEWLNRVLYDRERVRPYMKTRMPQYGETALEGLAGWFAEVDPPVAADINLLEPDEVEKLDRAMVAKLRNGGHQLLGDTGLNCIACHNFNGTESPAMKGLDLMTTYQRLQPGWFASYMKNPAAFRPGIIMPGYWPEGKALQTGVLDGDTELQLQALWHTFSLGRSARDPSGLRAPEIKLEVADKPLLHRGRSRVAGFRGIAVGFPGGMNYAFNAHNGALSALWQGGFVNVNWRSQGAGDFTPIGKIIALPQDVAFLRAAGDPPPWPLMPTTSKEQPVNPDPLYPRKHGYAFMGYAFDEGMVPTFTYRCDEVVIEDRSVPATVDGKVVLRRTLRFSAPAAGELAFRALTGEITPESAMAFKTPEIRLSFDQGKPLVRPAAGLDGKQELLIGLTLPQGTSTCTVDYAPLR